ncbi:MAG: hypothetical protein ACFCUQ_05250 [Kiloniellales bacterium]
MYEQHDLRQLDESQRRMNELQDPSARGSNMAGSLIALAIIAAVVLGAIWVATP